MTDRVKKIFVQLLLKFLQQLHNIWYPEVLGVGWDAWEGEKYEQKCGIFIFVCLMLVW